MHLTRLIHPDTGADVITTAAGIDALIAQGYKKAEPAKAAKAKKEAAEPDTGAKDGE